MKARVLLDMCSWRSLFLDSQDTFFHLLPSWFAVARSQSWSCGTAIHLRLAVGQRNNPSLCRCPSSSSDGPKRMRSDPRFRTMHIYPNRLDRDRGHKSCDTPFFQVSSLCWYLLHNGNICFPTIHFHSFPFNTRRSCTCKKCRNALISISVINHNLSLWFA